MSRRSLVVANWKMNGDCNEAVTLAAGCRDSIADSTNTAVVLAPSFPFVVPVNAVIANSSIGLGAQNLACHSSGAHTGEVSGEMLRSVGCSYVIIGHSERRVDQKETDSVVAAKVARAVESELCPIICVGESLAAFDEGASTIVVSRQLEEALSSISDDTSASLVVAYEPIWAIGTGLAATPGVVQQMHATLRSILVGTLRFERGSATRILYGGSVKPSNAAEIFAEQDVDGGLIGGASLDAGQFSSIVAAASQQDRKNEGKQ